MALDGEAITQIVYTINSNPVAINPVPDVPVNPLPGCCNEFTINVLADSSGLPLQNDVSTVIWWFDPIISGAGLTLKKWVNGVWEDQAAISNNSYGEFGAFGYYVNAQDQSFISLKIDWALVLAAFGAGSYKVTCTYGSGLFGDTDIDSYEFCLNRYTPLLADGTLRLEYWLSGTTEDITDDTKIKDFGTLNIYNSLRLKGYFGYDKSSYKEEDLELNPGVDIWVEDRRLPIFECTLLLLPQFIHRILRTDFMMADKRAVTDYNSKNNESFVQKYVMKESGYEPGYYPLQSPFATVELKFRPMNNRSRKFRD